MAAISQTAKPVESEFGELALRSQSNDRPDYSVNDPLAPISGLTNYGPTEMRTVGLWLEKIRNVFKLYGFTTIVSPPFENAQNLIKKGGLTKQIYGVSRVQDGSLTKLGIPFDHTVPTAIFVAKKMNEIIFPYKRAAIGYSCRGEHAVAGKGRYRAFYQCDVDIFAPQLTAGADAETITAMLKGLESLGIDDSCLYLNHVVIAKAFVVDAGVPKGRVEDALRIIDKLKPDNRKDVVDELVSTIPELNQESASQLLTDMNYQGSVSDFKFNKSVSKEVVEALNHLREIENTCVAMGVKKGRVQFSTSLTRGLDYYTGVVFETFIPGKERYGSIASGGRYDDLVDGFGAKAPVQGVGGSIGLTRLFDVMKELGRVDLSRQTSADVFVGYRTQEEYSKALEVTTALRNEGISVELYTVGKVQVGKQLDLCRKKGIPCSVLVMNPNELQIGNMRASDKSSVPTIPELIERVLGLKKQGIFEEQIPTQKDPDDQKRDD